MKANKKFLDLTDLGFKIRIYIFLAEKILKYDANELDIFFKKV